MRPRSRPSVAPAAAPSCAGAARRSIVALYRERTKDGSYPSLIVNSINLKRLLDLVAADRLTELASWFGTEIRRLADAGADFGLLSSNTPHIVFDALSAAAPIPLISIVETACQAATRQGLRRVGLLGTRFTMQGRFYDEAFSKAGIEVVTPGADDQTFVHAARAINRWGRIRSVAPGAVER